MDGAFESLRDLAEWGTDLRIQRSALSDGLLAHGVSDESVRLVMTYVRDGIVLHEDGTTRGRSRLFGPPLLPPGAAWPQDGNGAPLTFVAALDLAGLPGLDPLPADGTLLVYWSEAFPHAGLRTGTVVHHVAEPVAADPPAGASTAPAVPLTGLLMPVLGGTGSIPVATRDEGPLHEAVEDLDPCYGHHLLGSAREVQGPVLDEVADLLAEGSAADRAAYDGAELAGRGWTLLAQFESTDALMFGDAGVLYLVLPHTDLLAHRFDRVLGIMQSH